MAESIEFTTKLWKRSQNSYASTIPREVLAITNAPTDDNARVKWSISTDPDSDADVEVRFTLESEEGDNGN